MFCDPEKMSKACDTVKGRGSDADGVCVFFWAGRDSLCVCLCKLFVVIVVVVAVSVLGTSWQVTSSTSSSLCSSLTRNVVRTFFIQEVPTWRTRVAVLWNVCGSKKTLSDR